MQCIDSEVDSILGDFPKSVDDAASGSCEAQRNLRIQLLSDPEKARNFKRLIYNLMEFGTRS